MKKPYRLALGAIAALGALAPAAAKSAPAPLIPLRDFFRNPEKTAFELSPDGKLLAFLAPWENRLNIFVQDVHGGEPVRVTQSKDRDIREYLWVANGRLAYLLDKGGDENFRMYAVDADGSHFIALTDFEKVRTMLIDDLGELDDNHGEILIAINQRDPKVFDAYRVNTLTGKLTLVAENPGNIDSWIVDHQGRLRAASTSDGVNTSLLYREKDTDAFKTVLTTSFKETLGPKMFTFDNKYLYATSNLGRDKQALVTYDPAAAKEVQVIFQNADADVDGPIVSNKRKLLTGVTYETDKVHHEFFDPARKALQEDLEKRLPGYEVDVVSASKDETRMLVRSVGDKTRGAYYYYDRPAGDFHKLVEISPWLKEDQLADMKPVSFQSRDGLTLHGYLTLPRGVEPKNLPAVLNPHGGPWARDSWGFDSEVQFLANRGYAVLQVNYRGSTGFGRKFWEASFKKWGLTMQDDLSDGVKWLIKDGVADPKRVGIYGGSYGGYATLAGMTLTPELYACGVDYVGVANLFTFMKTIPPYWLPYLKMMQEMVGDPETDKALLEAASPVFHVDQIRAPLFIAQGANDPRVNKAESDQMVAALKKRDIEVPYMVKADEGHGFHNEENRFDFYGAMEQFLAKHLGGRAESADKAKQPLTSCSDAQSAPSPTPAPRRSVRVQVSLGAI